MRCFVPYAIDELEKTERWLNEQAARGKVLEAWGGLLVRFSKKEETGFCYRLDADDGKREANGERRRALSEAGWEYVATLGGNGYIHIYRAPEGTPAFLEDVDLKKKAARSYRLGGWGYLLCMLFYACILLGTFYLWWRWPLTELLTENVRKVLVYPGILLLAFASFGWDAFRMARASKRLSFGWRTPEGGKRMEKKRRMPDGMRGILVIAALVLVLVSHFAFRKERYRNFGDVYPPVLAVDLRNVETEENFQLEAFSMREHPGINMANRMKMKKNILNGVFYETDQYGTYGSGNDVLFPYLSGQYCEVKGDFLADALLEQFIVRYTEYDGRANKPAGKRWKKAEREKPGFLRLVTAEEEVDNAGGGGSPRKLVFARTPDLVICLHYTGRASMEQLLGALCETFSKTW